MRANSITESDYVAAGRACQRALWMKQAFVDYNITIDEVKILCDDTCAINLTSSPIDYLRTKHIEIIHHFLKDNVAKKHITTDKIPLRENVANILTKALEKDQFSYLRLGLGLMLQEEEEEKKGQDVIEEKMPNLEGSVNKGELGESSKKLKRKFETMKGYEARMESREMLFYIHHSLKMLLDIISKMNRKLEDENVKRNDKGKDKIPNGKLTHIVLEHAYMFVACVVLCLLVASCSQEHLEGDALDPWIPSLE
ncbi:hypothetical protein Tco_0664432 [Tanacetum coccineum]